MIRTIGELIDELRKWPANGLVGIGMKLETFESGTGVSIVSVDGYAGAAIDGRDSGVTIAIESLPSRYSPDKARRTR